MREENDEMKSEFEKLEYVAEKLPYIKWSDELECYIDNGLASGIASWVNGAWYAYQEQQKDYVCDCGYLDSVDDPEVIVLDNLKNELTNLSNVLSVFGIDRFVDEIDSLMQVNGIAFKKELLK